MNIIIYEDKAEYFEPLVYFYPQFSLMLGMMTIAENTVRFFKKTKVYYITRPCFENKKFNITGPALYLSARAVISRRTVISSRDVKFVMDSQPVGFVKQKPPFPKNIREIKRVLKEINAVRELDGFFVGRLWDLIRLNDTVLANQFTSLRPKHRVQKHIHIIGGKDKVFIDPKAQIHEFVIFDVSDGPVYIDREAIIRPFSTVIGPSYIGPGTIIDRAKIIRSSIGPFCRIGGEVESCIFQGYGNKYHEGFIGHSFIGEWVNLGALTTNSDLKNNYGTVRVKMGKRELDSGMQKLGCFIGDHSKTGIGTLIPTGATIGSFTNFFGGGMMPKNVPSFTWLNSVKTRKYDLEKAIATAKIVMQRRDISLSGYYEGLIRNHYKWQSSL